ncbi:hypothetical protein KQX54_011014 [Cotesia glomerata]|uniref:RING-type domain-containing protein n=1 Tax=Cotesia glomerata TaxID=32391 RepID=A0AAV7HY31_COTGL|nr:hypothetical protein KQX54_011014 [Cotesia glomerata]
MHAMRTGLNRLQANPTTVLTRFPRANNSCLRIPLLRRLWRLITRREISINGFLERSVYVQDEYCDNLIFTNELLLEHQLIKVEVSNDLIVNGEAPRMTCSICGMNPIEMVCLPCLHTQMCRQCSINTRDAARNRNVRVQCPFCNQPAQFEAGKFRRNPDGSILMVCEQCEVAEVSIGCVPCLHIRFCEGCYEEMTINDISICSTCGQRATFRRGYFP